MRMGGTIAALVVAAAVAGCSGATPTTPPRATIDPIAACLEAEYFDGVYDVDLANGQAAPGQWLAICDHDDGTGAVLLIDKGSEAAAACEDDQAGSRLVKIIREP